jgi:predicted adenine nucleotide alpha hydrolase (AANH) superfamily ATPase
LKQIINEQSEEAVDIASDELFHLSRLCGCVFDAPTQNKKRFLDSERLRLSS